jgi:DnaJ-class molecular chaperone
MTDHRVAEDNAHAALIPEGKRCSRCEGTGNEFMFMYRQCKACGGDGISRGNEPLVDAQAAEAP